jgi:hypothetical protein
MAKIEIKSKPIQKTEFLGNLAPQHLYIVNIRDNGEDIAYRGGPEGGDNMKNLLFDDLKVTRLLYNKNHPDFDEKNNHPSKLLVIGSDSELAPIIEKINNAMDIINSNSHDYKVAIPGVTWGSWQNSNTIARYLIEAAGIKFELPKHPNGMSVLAPGWDEQITHSLFDKTGAGQFWGELYENINIKVAEKARQVLEEYSILESKVKSIYDRFNEYNKEQFRDCIKKYESGHKKILEEHGELEKIFSYFDNPALYEDISNQERFKLLSERAVEKGDDKYATGFQGMYAQQGMLEEIFDAIDKPEYYEAENNMERLKYAEKVFNEALSASNEQESIVADNQPSNNEEINKLVSGLEKEISELTSAFNNCNPTHSFEL